jgi:hypothetical protein
VGRVPKAANLINDYASPLIASGSHSHADHLNPASWL